MKWFPYSHQRAKTFEDSPNKLHSHQNAVILDKVQASMCHG